jgi:two-component system cell cycle response regulator
MGDSATVLVVDDSALNRKLLERLLVQEGYQVVMASNGREALAQLDGSDARRVDVVLLDIVMPEMDGFEVLQRLRNQGILRRIPVIMISAVEEVESVARCIELGATDYLPKPFNVGVLRARLSASLAEKRLRDTEREYLEQVEAVTGAAAALEAGRFEAASLEAVARRNDALGQLARVFQRMAAEVRAREDQLTRELRELRIEVDEARKAAQVRQITESDYFKDLRTQAAELRGIFGGGQPPG